MGKPNQKLKAAPLVPIPPFEAPFDRVIVDIVALVKKKKTHLATVTF